MHALSRVATAAARAAVMPSLAVLSVAALSAAALAMTAPAAAAPYAATRTAASLRTAAAVRTAASLRTAATPAQSGCYYKFVPPNSWIEVCQNGGGSGGGGGGGGGGSLVCYLNPMTPAEVAALGLPPAPPGEEWEYIRCPALQIPIGNVILVSKNGGPPVTPQELLQIALGELTVPELQPRTAPPLNRPALVGLPEWFWIPPAQWHPISVTVTVGPVWARLTATPNLLTFDPGGGLAPSSCPGPGTSYRSAPSGGAGCQFKYLQSSALQPGGAYAAAVTVTWAVTWTGSGGTGGTVNAGLQMPYPFSLRVAEGQALVTGP